MSGAAAERKLGLLIRTTTTNRYETNLQRTATARFNRARAQTAELDAVDAHKKIKEHSLTKI